MRRLFGKFTFVPVLLILGAFVLFAIKVSEPLRKAERKSLVTGTIHPVGELRQEGPFIPYVALNRGRPVKGAFPEFPLDDRQPDADGRFELSADPGDGTRFYLLVRYETARQERYCKTVELPEVRQTEDGNWVEAATGKPLPPQRVEVDKSVRCD